MALNQISFAERPRIMSCAVGRGEAGSVSPRKRKLVERIFGWSKLDRHARQVKLRGLERVDWFWKLNVTAHNLIRMRRLIPIETGAF